MTLRNEPNEPISQPYCLMDEVTACLAEVLGEQQLIQVTNPTLQYITAVKATDTYTLMVSSPAAQDEHFDIISDIGEIISIEELPTTDGVEGLPEFLPVILKSLIRMRQKKKLTT